MCVDMKNMSIQLTIRPQQQILQNSRNLPSVNMELMCTVTERGREKYQSTANNDS